jgi:Ion channel
LTAAVCGHRLSFSQAGAVGQLWNHENNQTLIDARRGRSRIAVILGGIFRKQAISADDILGAFCGYLLIGVAWANLYAMTYLLVPGALRVKPELLWRLGEWHLQHALFDYLSFTTLTSLGYSDISPIGAPAYSLTWLEVLFGQFYMAVVVAQLVGFKLAEAMKGDAPPR